MRLLALPAASAIADAVLRANAKIFAESGGRTAAAAPNQPRVKPIGRAACKARPIALKNRRRLPLSTCRRVFAATIHAQFACHDRNKIQRVSKCPVPQTDGASSRSAFGPRA
jgi:hypothetical protein